MDRQYFNIKGEDYLMKRLRNPEDSNYKVVRSALTFMEPNVFDG